MEVHATEWSARGQPSRGVLTHSDGFLFLFERNNFFHFILKGQSQVLRCRVWCTNGINSIVNMLANSQFDLALLVSKELYYWLFMSMRMTFGQWGKCL